MLDEIELKLKGAKFKEFIEPVCCFRGCPLKVVAALHLAGEQGHDIYLLCKDHKTDLAARHPSSLGAAVKQAVFFF